MNDFVHLHLHSEYSLLDGACRISEIPAYAASCNHHAVALTDHGVMYGVMAFYDACVSAGIKPIIGCEVYVAPGSMHERAVSTQGPDHLILLCENMTGYKNLIKLVSKSFTEGFYSKPRIDMELLSSHAEGLIGLSACLAGRIPKQLSAGNFTAACDTARTFSKIFGPDHFYIELQNHGIAEQKQILPQLKRLAQICSLPMVATNDCHYLRKKDAPNQAILQCIQTNSVITDGRPLGFETDEFYYKTTEEMESLFADYEGAISNTVKIADMCDLVFPKEGFKLPKFDCPKGLSAESYLLELTKKGFERRVSEGDIVFTPEHDEKTYRERLEYELSVINKMGYADYFLIVQEYVNYAKKHNIPVGPGRGSGAGSLVAYVIGITEVDSIRFDLLFERFLNPERVSMPDIDVDFCFIRREEVIEHVKKLYGSDRVSQIITFGTLAARQSVRDVGRAYGMSYSDVDEVAKLIPRDLGITLEKAMQVKELKDLYASSNSVKKLIDTAMALEGMPRNVSVHAAGVLITDRPVTEYVPLATSGGNQITQFDMDTVAHLGLLKFDFLGLRYLTIIDDAEREIRESDPSFRIDKVPLDDKKTYELISSGRTDGVFQLESDGFKKMLTELRPDTIDDIQAAIALYRPGPMDSIPAYIAARHDPASVRYAIPQLEPILRSTYGCIIYQEQVMQIFRVVAGYSFGHADIVRRAMSKKKADVLAAERESFLEGARQNGIDGGEALKLFEGMEDFANYAFNKSHAAAYGLVTYRTAYLKANYPKEYFAALLTSVLDNLAKISQYIDECAGLGIKVLPPDINESHASFHVSGDHIRFGLSALKNIGENFIRSLEEERRNGPFRSFENFIGRMSGNSLNKRMVESLIKSGAFDSLGRNRSQLLVVYEQLIDHESKYNRDNPDGQLDMFSASGIEDADPTVEYPNIPELSFKDRLNMEKEVSGMYFSGHLLDSFSRHISFLKPVQIFRILSEEEDPDLEGETLTLAGIIKNVSRRTTKRGDQMATFLLEDKTGDITCLVFSSLLMKVNHQIREEHAIILTGTINHRDNEPPEIIVKTIEPLRDNDDFKTSDPVNQTSGGNTPVEIYEPAAASDSHQGMKKLYLRLPDFEGRPYQKAVNLAQIFPGPAQLILYSSKDKRSILLQSGIALDGYILNEYREMLGAENVVEK